jgi:membrane protease subunit (stomatin/prohibitin family)
LDEAVSTTFERLKFGGVTPQNQEVFYVNLIESNGIKFGTSSPIRYFDNFYNAEMFLRVFGTYSVRISDPLLFYSNVVSKNTDRYGVTDFSGQHQHEFFVALSSVISQYSGDGEVVSLLSAKYSELSSAMKEALTEKWRNLRGIDVVSVMVVNFSYDEKSQKIIDAHNRGV